MQGKFFLSKWDTDITVRVPFADFSGMSLWQAINQIAEVADARFGFKPDGSFYFKSRPRFTSNPVYTFTNIGQNRIVEIEKSRGLEYIINSSVKIPNELVMADIEVTMELAPNSPYVKYAEIKMAESNASSPVGKEISMLVADLEDENFITRAEAALKLGELESPRGNAKVINVLMKRLMREQEPFIRNLIIRREEAITEPSLLIKEKEEEVDTLN